MADTNQILRLAAIIREVDGTHSKGAASLAESIFNHPDFRAALADEPAVPQSREPAAVTGQPSDEELALIYHDCCRGCEFMDQGGFEDAARAVLARWGNPAPAPPADGEVAEVMGLFRHWAEAYPDSVTVDPYWLTRAAELLERQVLVPVAVSDALIKAECALSDIAEGEPMTDEGDPLQWAERRCADTLAIIRPTMMQHKIRTSEWPPLPLPEVSE